MWPDILFWLAVLVIGFLLGYTYAVNNAERDWKRKKHEKDDEPRLSELGQKLRDTPFVMPENDPFRTPDDDGDLLNDRQLAQVELYAQAAVLNMVLPSALIVTTEENTGNQFAGLRVLTVFKDTDEVN